MDERQQMERAFCYEGFNTKAKRDAAMVGMKQYASAVATLKQAYDDPFFLLVLRAGYDDPAKFEKNVAEIERAAAEAPGVLENAAYIFAKMDSEGRA